MSPDDRVRIADLAFALRRAEVTPGCWRWRLFVTDTRRNPIGEVDVDGVVAQALAEEFAQAKQFRRDVQEKAAAAEVEAQKTLATETARADDLQERLDAVMAKAPSRYKGEVERAVKVAVQEERQRTAAMLESLRQKIECGFRLKEESCE